MELARMHDVAGCRLIFNDIKSLVAYRENLHKARFLHKRRKANEDAYNYIISPRARGYRGIHDVYEYCASHEGGKAWDGLLIEIQFRTKYQHAWATAVEVAGSLTGNNAKFNQGSEKYKEFFKLSSEIIARAYENSKSCYGSLSNKQLVSKFASIDKDIKLLRTLEGVNKTNTKLSKGQNVILVFSEKNKSLQAYTYDSLPLATIKYFELENTNTDNNDIVLVRAESIESIRNAFRNYFSDTQDFVKLIRKGLEKLSKT